ncbi:MAG: hypothetical protein JKY27_01155 [Magnetovibrio sp.]|nr:hypothetical protein [Magnetovibrio sp.]
MDNIITGVIGIAIFLAFIGGLAQTIGETPFVIIVLIVGSMAAYDVYENIRDNRNPNKPDEAS